MEMMMAAANPQLNILQVDASCLDVVQGMLDADRQAIGIIYERFNDLLLRKAERLIPERMRARVDPNSVVMSVFGSILDLSENQKAQITRYRINDWGQLFGLLATILVRKCANRMRGLRTQKRDIGKEKGLADWDGAAPVASPDEEALAADLLQTLVKDLQPTEMEIIRYRLEGHEFARIANHLGITLTSVETVLRRFQRRVQRMIDQSAEEA